MQPLEPEHPPELMLDLRGWSDLCNTVRTFGKSGEKSASPLCFPVSMEVLMNELYVPAFTSFDICISHCRILDILAYRT